MNTNTPLDLTPFGVVLQGIGLLYWFVVLTALALILWKAKGWLWKALLVTTVLAIMLGPVAVHVMRRNSEQQQAKAKLDEAKRLFDERCKTAGEKIYKTVENVEGVLLLNIRQEDRPGIGDNPLWPDAALPHEATGDQYIRNFLFTEYDGSPADHPMVAGERGFLSSGGGAYRILSQGYHYVDVKQADGTTLRYRLKEPRNIDRADLVNEPVTGTPARYAVGFVNQVNPEDRAHWVAGTTITVTDTQTNEVIATRESYSFEAGLGSKAGGRQPWRFAVTCPTFSGWDGGRTRFFVDQFLKPKQGE
jgi:hypothetical protein